MPNHDLDAIHAHALKQVRGLLHDQRGNDPLPVLLETQLRNIAESKVNGTDRDGLAVEKARAEIRANENVVHDLGGMANVNKAIARYVGALDETLGAQIGR